MGLICTSASRTTVPNKSEKEVTFRTTEGMQVTSF